VHLATPAQIAQFCAPEPVVRLLRADLRIQLVPAGIGIG
jgi:hypothetical protein